MFDLLVRNGRIIDGTGQPGYHGDVAIQAGRIVETGRIGAARAQRVIDADGLIVAPGFIDHHTHLDAQLLWDPLASSSCWHGVTTVVTGNCSLSLAPCKPEDRSDLVSGLVRVEAISRKALEAGVDWRWTTFGQYLKRLEEQRGVNVACLVGHTAIRQFAMGAAATERAASADEIEVMCDQLRLALRVGAAGMSINQSKHHFLEDGRALPSTVAQHDELLALARVMAETNVGLLQVNGGTMGTEVDPRDNYAFLRSLADANGRPMLFNQIAHKWQTPELWKEVLKLGEQCLADGYRIHGTCSTLPTSFEFTLMNVQLLFDNMPTWRPLMFAPRAERLAGFADPARRPLLRFEALEEKTIKSFHKRWELVTIEKTFRPENACWLGSNIAALAAQQGKHPVDAFLDLALSENLDTVFKTVLGNGDKEAVGQMLRHPATIVGTSDAGAHTSFLADYGYCTELLGPWVRDRGLMSLEQAVSRLTLMPATLFGFDDRGQIRPGFAADLVLFDAATVAPCKPELVFDYPAGEARQAQAARGIEATIVNGEVLIENGRHSGALPGRVLRNARAEAS